MRMSIKPKWWLLYILLLVGLVLLMAADFESSSVGWREIAEGALSFGTLVAIWCWVRGNRVALAIRDGDWPADQTQPTQDTTTLPGTPPGNPVLVASRVE